MRLTEQSIDRLEPEDQDAILEFQAFLRAVGPLTDDPEAKRRRKEWIEADPEPRLAYLGLTRDQAREWGYDV